MHDSLPLPSPEPSSGPPPASQGALALSALAYASLVNEASASLDVLVTRQACARGKTGETLEPQIAPAADVIVITIDVALPPEGAYDCPANDRVPVTVTLPGPIGDRRLVDGGVRSRPPAVRASCNNDVRWTPAA